MPRALGAQARERHPSPQQTEPRLLVVRSQHDIHLRAQQRLHREKCYAIDSRTPLDCVNVDDDRECRRVDQSPEVLDKLAGCVEARFATERKLHDREDGTLARAFSSRASRQHRYFEFKVSGREQTRSRGVLYHVSGNPWIGSAIAVATVLLFSSTLEAAPKHWRIETEHGPTHVWLPALYDVSTAGIVVYVHGYFTDVDNAWKHHRLAAQFAKSQLNAMFIVCEAPGSSKQDITWASVSSLLDTIDRKIALPEGRLVVVGHSAAHRTMSAWLVEDRIDTLVLVDALYGHVDEFRDWVEADETRRLIDAAVVTRPWSEQLHAGLDESLVFDRFPRTGQLDGAREARVVYVRSQHDHMALVTGGVALPMLLRAVQLPVFHAD